MISNSTGVWNHVERVVTEILERLRRVIDVLPEKTLVAIFFLFNLVRIFAGEVVDYREFQITVPVCLGAS